MKKQKQKQKKIEVTSVFGLDLAHSTFSSPWGVGGGLGPLQAGMKGEGGVRSYMSNDFWDCGSFQPQMPRGKQTCHRCPVGLGVRCGPFGLLLLALLHLQGRHRDHL